MWPGEPQRCGNVVGTFQALVDRTTAGQQCVFPGTAVCADCPVDIAVVSLQDQYKFDGLFQCGPQLPQEVTAPGNQVMMPEAGGVIGDKVGFPALTVIDLVSAISRPPAAVMQLCFRQPAIGALGGSMLPADGERHGCLDVVPGVAVAAIEPGYFTAAFLGVENEFHRRSEKLVGEQSRTEIQA